MRTNIEIVEEQTDSILDSLIQSLPDSIQTIGLNAGQLQPEKRSFIIGRIARISGSYGKSVSLDSGEQLIFVENFTVLTSYDEKTLKMFGLNQTMIRNVNTGISGYVLDKRDQTISNTFHYRSGQEDVISSSDLSALEQSPFSFTKGIIQNKLKWTKYIEPGIVVVSVSALIYLFYSMRY